jgi:hypothetical protein
MSSKENLQLFLSPRLTARSARAAQDEDKLSDLQVTNYPYISRVCILNTSASYHFFIFRIAQSGY